MRLTLSLIVRVGRVARRLAANDCELHMLDFDSHEEKVDFAQDDVFKVVLGPVVLELDVQAFLNAHLHLDGLLRQFCRLCLQCRRLYILHAKVLLTDKGAIVIPRYGDANKVSQAHIETAVRLVHLFPVELERVGLCRRRNARWLQLAHNARKLYGAAPLLVQLDLPNHLNLYSQVLNLFPRWNGNLYRARYALLSAVDELLFRPFVPRTSHHLFWSPCCAIEVKVDCWVRLKEHRHPFCAVCARSSKSNRRARNPGRFNPRVE